MPHVIEEAFGKDCCLYTDVLNNCPRDADKAVLRKAYYRAALQHHPDKQTGNATKFQAVSLAYELLQDADTRAEYDETGYIPADGVAEDDDKQKDWKDYFDLIFGKVTTSDIDAFSSKYKCSDEERRDVLKEFKARKGSLIKMLDYVMLSTERDALRWCEDYLRPALDLGELDAKFTATMEKTLLQCQKKVEQEDAQDKTDDEETESEEEEEEVPVVAHKQPKAAAARSKKTPPKKAKPTKTKKKKASAAGNMDDLVAQIQNKRRGGGASMLASLGARYGVAMDDDTDPLSDADFGKAQAKLKKRR